MNGFPTSPVLQNIVTVPTGGASTQVNFTTPGASLQLPKDVLLVHASALAEGFSQAPVYCSVAVGNINTSTINLLRGWVSGNGSYGYTEGLFWFGAVAIPKNINTFLFLSGRNDTGTDANIVVQAWVNPNG